MRSWWVIMIALETGGRWSGEAVEFIDMMAGARAREVLPIRVETSVDAHAECVCELPGGSCSRRVEWH